jgi:hypothetical protein
MNANTSDLASQGGKGKDKSSGSDSNNCAVQQHRRRKSAISVVVNNRPHQHRILRPARPARPNPAPKKTQTLFPVLSSQFPVLGAVF